VTDHVEIEARTDDVVAVDLGRQQALRRVEGPARTWPSGDTIMLPPRIIGWSSDRSRKVIGRPSAAVAAG